MHRPYIAPVWINFSTEFFETQSSNFNRIQCNSYYYFVLLDAASWAPQMFSSPNFF